MKMSLFALLLLFPSLIVLLALRLDIVPLKCSGFRVYKSPFGGLKRTSGEVGFPDSKPAERPTK